MKKQTEKIKLPKTNAKKLVTHIIHTNVGPKLEAELNKFLEQNADLEVHSIHYALGDTDGYSVMVVFSIPQERDITWE